MNRLNNTVKAGLLTEPAWIGLYNTSWRWSLGDTELGTVVFWDKKHGEINDQPDNVKNNEFCVFMRNGSWHDENCSTQHNFVCYGEFPCQSAFSLSFLPSFCLSTSQTPNSLNSVNRFIFYWKSFFSTSLFTDMYLSVWTCLYWNMLLYISSLLIYLLFFQIDTNLTSMYILITEKKTWSEAQHYCRQNHTDLASVRNGADNNAIQKAIHNVIQASSFHFT